MLMSEHKVPLQHKNKVEITSQPSRDYRLIAEYAGTIIKKRAELDKSNQELRQEKKALADAHIDPITRLPDRASYEKERKTIIERAAEFDRPVGMAVIDGLGFKGINDTFGHATGDKALRVIANGILSGVRRTDKVYRIGGDEFAVLMPDYGDKTDMSEDELNKVTSGRIEEALQKEVDAVGFPKEISLKVSVGVGMLRPGESPSDFYERIDAEMYAHKQQQKNGTNLVA